MYPFRFATAMIPGPGLRHTTFAVWESREPTDPRQVVFSLTRLGPRLGSLKASATSSRTMRTGPSGKIQRLTLTASYTQWNGRT